MRSSSTPSRVLVIDSEPLSRFGLVSLLKSHESLAVVGEAESLRTGRELCASLQPQVVIIDPAMEGGQGFTLLKDVPRWAEQARTIAFSAREDAASVLRAFSFGASGYIARRDPIASIVLAVVGVASGDRHIGPSIEKLLLGQMAAGAIELKDDGGLRLSAREWQVFRMMGEGRGVREVAETLGVSVKTVESHQRRMKDKLGTRSGAELRRKAAIFVDGEGRGAPSEMAEALVK